MLRMAILAMINLCNTKEILLLLFWCFDCFSNLFQYVFHWEIFIQMFGHLRNYHSDVHSVEKLSLRCARCWEIITQMWTLLRNYSSNMHFIEKLSLKCAHCWKIITQIRTILRNYPSNVHFIEKLSLSCIHRWEIII